MRILLVITSLGVGGAERLVSSLADRYALVGHEVVLVRLHGQADILPSNPAVRVENLAMRKRPLSVLQAMARFRSIIKEFRPDVVNSHLVHANIIARLLRLVTTMPRLISSAHNNNEGGMVRILSYRLTDRLADISTNVSEQAVKAFEKQGSTKPGRMVCLYNGIDVDNFSFDPAARLRVREELGVQQRAPLLLAVGRLREAKDYANLLNAFAHLSVGEYAPHLAIVGDGPLDGTLKTLAAQLGVEGRVSFLGVRHDIPDLMSACDVFVLSSAWEGFGLVVAEAMACERVVVATDCGGVREVVGDVGFLVPPRDYSALAIQLTVALRMSRKDRQRLGSSARERVIRNFSLGATADRYLDVYQAKL